MVLKNLKFSMIIVPVYCLAVIGILLDIGNYSMLKCQSLV